MPRLDGYAEAGQAWSTEQVKTRSGNAELRAKGGARGASTAGLIAVIRRA